MPATYQILATPRRNGAPVTGATITYTPSNPAVLTVNATGLVTAVAPGSATVTVASGTGSFLKTFTVAYAGALVVVSGVINPASPSVAVGDDVQLATTWYSGAGGTGSVVSDSETYASGTPAVATVGADTGLVSGVAEGSATITATADSNGVTATRIVEVTAVPTEPDPGWTPQFMWDPTEGYLPEVRTGASVAAQPNVETFSYQGAYGTERFDGGGTYGIHTPIVYAGPDAEDTTMGGYSAYPNMTEAIEEAVPYRGRWVKYTIGAAPGWIQVSSRVVLSGSDVNGAADFPIPFEVRLAVRGTAGKSVYFSVQKLGGAEITNATQVLSAGVEHEVVLTGFIDHVRGATNLDIQVAAVLQSPAEGDEYAVLDMVPRLPQVFALAIEQRMNLARAGQGNPMTVKTALNTLPLHPERGVAFFGSAESHLGSDVAFDLADAARWTLTNATITESAVPGPDHAIYDHLTDKALIPGRFWFDTTMAAGGTIRLATSLQLLQSGYGSGDGDDAVANGTMTNGTQGRDAWAHITLRDTGGTFPEAGDLTARLTGTAAYTGPLRIIRDTPTSATYHGLFRIPVAVNNVATTFTVFEIENTSGVALAFQCAAIWIERENYLAINMRNAGGPEEWVPLRPRYEAGVPYAAPVFTMKRARIDYSDVLDFWNHTLHIRTWMGVDPEDMRGKPNILIKTHDTGPNASSLLAYIFELITNAAGVLTMKVYMSNTGTGGPVDPQDVHILEWPVPAGLFRRYDFNDITITVTPATGVRELVVNGQVFLESDPDCNTAAKDLTGATWNGNQVQPIWLGMDRDLDCAWKGWHRVIEFTNTPATLEQILARPAYLNWLGKGTVAA